MGFKGVLQVYHFCQLLHIHDHFCFGHLPLHHHKSRKLSVSASLSFMESAHYFSFILFCLCDVAYAW